MSDQAARDLASDVPRQPRLLAPGQFSIGWLLLLTLWIALCLAAFRMSPVIGAFIGLWSVPAAIRALYSVQHWKRRRGIVSWGDVYDIFGSSLILAAAAELGGLIAVGFASAIVMGLSALLGFPLPLAVVVAMAVSLFAGATAAGIVLWLGRPSRFDKPA